MPEVIVTPPSGAPFTVVIGPGVGLSRSDADLIYQPRSSSQIDAGDFGAMGLSAGSDDTAVITAAIAAAQAQGKRNVRIPSTPWGIGVSGRLVFPTGIYPVADVTVKRNGGQSPGAMFRLLTPTSGIDVGGFALSSSVQGGVWGGFSIDAQSIARQPFRIGFMSQSFVLPIQVRNEVVAGTPDGGNDPLGGGDPQNDMIWNRQNASVLIDYAQNSELWLNVANGLGNGVVFDRGTGGNTVHLESADYGGTGGSAVVFQQSEDSTLPASISPYPVPQDNALFGWGGLERGGPNAYALINHLAGAKNSIDNAFLADGKSGISDRPLVRMRNLGVGVSGPFHVGKIIGNGAKNTGTAFDIGAGCSVVLERYSQWRGFRYAFKLGVGARVFEAIGQSWNVDAMLDPASGGTLSDCIRNITDAGLFVARQNATDPVILSQLTLAQALVSTIVGSTTITCATAVWSQAHAGTTMTLAQAGDVNPAMGAPRLDLPTAIQSVALDGKSVVVATAPFVTLSSTWAKFTEAWPRWKFDAVGNFYSGDGSVNPPKVVDATQWPALGGVLGSWRRAKRVGDDSQVVNNSATLVPDNRLFGPVAANTYYVFEVVFWGDGPTAADIAVGFIFPSGTNGTWGGTGPPTGAASGGATVGTYMTSNKGIANTASFGTVDAGNQQTTRLTGSFLTGNTAGTFGFRWAQATATLADTIVKPFSYISVAPA